MHPSLRIEITHNRVTQRNTTNIVQYISNVFIEMFSK